MCAAKAKTIHTITTPQRGASALVGHVAQNLLFFLSFFVQIEQVKNPILFPFWREKVGGAEIFIVYVAQKFSTMWITFVQNREIHICVKSTKTLTKNNSFCALCYL